MVGGMLEKRDCFSAGLSVKVGFWEILNKIVLFFLLFHIMKRLTKCKLLEMKCRTVTLKQKIKYYCMPCPQTELGLNFYLQLS